MPADTVRRPHTREETQINIDLPLFQRSNEGFTSRFSSGRWK